MGIMNKIEQIQDFLKKQPGDAFLTHALALEFIKTEDLEKARILFKELLGRKPDYIGSYYHLAALLVKMGEKEQAVEWYEKGIDAAKKAGDQHALRELQSAMEELIF
jgi:Tfp pilus assembly protein PilF